MSELVTRFRRLWAELVPIGRRKEGGYDRFAWGEADAELRSWFHSEAAARGLAFEQDRNGNLWAWWGHDPSDGPPRAGSIAAGSHLDSVPGGGAYDGPLGVVSAFLALDELRGAGHVPQRPIAVVAFTEEEGARFGVACLGSRLSVGELDPARARALRDASGVSLADAMRAAGADPAMIGEDGVRLSRLAAFIEVHVEPFQSSVAGCPLAPTPTTQISLGEMTAVPYQKAPPPTTVQAGPQPVGAPTGVATAEAAFVVPTTSRLNVVMRVMRTFFMTANLPWRLV